MSRRVRLLLLVVAVTALVSVVVAAWRAGQPRELVLRVEPIASNSGLTVYVAGAVANPGLYTLPSRSRVASAVDLAGLLEDSDVAAVNMAALLKDGQQVYVPIRSAQTKGGGVMLTPGATPIVAGRVNVNTATAKELEALPGVGPVLASRIVAYREVNGPFVSLESLEDVQGISARMIDDFRAVATSGDD